ncbi:TPA: hypothetical protein ACGY72_001523 [Stenotrophomonas maltophilia]
MTLLSRLGSLLSLRVQLDERVPLSYKLRLSMEYGMCLIRGALTWGVRESWLSPLFRGRGVVVRCASRIRLGKGVRLGDFVVLDGLGASGITFGDSVKIGDFGRLICSGSLTHLGEGISIGHRVGIGEFCRIGGSGGVSIGEDTIVGQYFSVHPENHEFSDKQRLIREQGTARAPVVVGANCWIGAKVTLLAGSEVGHSSVVAAGSVVNSRFPPYSVIGGVPARLIKSY